MQNRKVIVEFKTPAGDKRLDGIEVKFSVEKVAGSIMNKATIDICNLTKEDIQYLTSYTSQFIAMAERKRVRIFAGYEDTGVSLIFDGDIVEAIPYGLPDTWLKCKAMSGYYSNKDVVSKTFEGDLTAQEICSSAADLLELSLDYQSTITKKISDFSFTGDKTKIIKELNEIGGIAVYEDDGVLVVTDKEQPNKSVSIRHISETSGMIGIPKPDPLGVELQMLLDNSLKIGQQIYLESLTIPSCSGVYYIYELKHSGDLRGNEFYTNIKARRFGSVTGEL